MTKWSNFTSEELERRRMDSVAALKRLDQQDFDKWYQEVCDTDYWKFGQCCAGCDFWNSEKGYSGECRAAGIVSGREVLASIGIVSWSGPLKPGYPMTHGDHWCGQFRDEFDWSILDRDYLGRVGALDRGSLKSKPRSARAV